MVVGSFADAVGCRPAAQVACAETASIFGKPFAASAPGRLTSGRNSRRFATVA